LSKPVMLPLAFLSWLQTFTNWRQCS